MRIAEIAPGWLEVPPRTYGGIENVVGLLADGLMERGHDVTLFAASGSRSSAELVETRDAPAGAARIGNVWDESANAFAAYMRAESFDVIHDHSGIVGPALGAMLGRPPVVHTLHGPWSPDAREYYALLHERIHLVAISEAQRAENPAIRYAGVVHNAIDLERHPLVERKEDWLLFLGRSSPDKGPDEAIETARRAGLPLKMVVKRADESERAFWEAEVAPRLGSDVEVLDDVDQEEKVSLLGRARATLFPIRWAEPFGLVMVESMACGTPVIARPMGAAPEVISDGVTGFLRETVAEMAAAVQVAPDIDPWACRAHVEKRFSPGTMIGSYERIFERVAG